MELDLIKTIAIYAIPVVFAITLHEAAHGYVAKYFGDLTAYTQGRISLNPLRHIDPIGTVLVPLIILAASNFFGSHGILFGWAKPVPVNYSALRHPKRDMLWVAIAGPAANLFMVFIWAIIYKVSLLTENFYFFPVSLMGQAGIEINVILMVLNLLPIPPLDGGRVAISLLPHKISQGYAQLEPYGFPLLLILLFTGALSLIMSPLINFVISYLKLIFHI